VYEESELISIVGILVANAKARPLYLVPLDGVYRAVVELHEAH
jgi:hypothetical protein